jgi:hypothetical protein
VNDAAEAITLQASQTHCRERIVVLAERTTLSPYRRYTMNSIIYIVGLVVIVGAILSYFGFR